MARVIANISENDVIVARATAPGSAAVAMVRLSGPRAIEIGAQVFQPDRSGSALGSFVSGHLGLGRLVDANSTAIFDQALAVVWRAPNSYTGENVVEFHVHGSPLIVDHLLAACIHAGARLARPGEFTRRAFLNGRLDLAQAEAVCDLINAHTQSAGRAAIAQLTGGLSTRLHSIRQSLVPVIAELEAFIDFPEEGLEFQTRARLGAVVDKAIHDLAALAASSSRGMRLRDGARIVLAGRPNSGKSSLFNVLVGRERAIVTPHPGTTRDTVEAEIDLGGIPVTFVDTAGLRDTSEEIEAIGIERTREELRGADLVLFVVDGALSQSEHQSEYKVISTNPHILVVNKMDISVSAESGGLISGSKSAGPIATCNVSALTRTGIPELEECIIQALGGRTADDSGAVTNRRHLNALQDAVKELRDSAESLASGLSPEFIVVDLTEAVAFLDQITGRSGLDEEVLDAIFSKFCLGK